MKKHLKLILSSLALAILTLGCSTVDKLYDRQVTEFPGEIIRTNTVMVAESKTNAVTGEISHTITPVVTYDYAPPTYVTNLVAKPLVDGAIKTVGGLPIPFAGTIGLGLSTILSMYAAIRNKRMARALVLGIEAGRKFLNETSEGQRLDSAIKDKLIEHQEIAGVLNEVSKLVNSVTGNTR